MTFLLSSNNVFDYLRDRGLCDRQEQELGKIEPKRAKNFNLLLNLPQERKLLVKQEPRDRDGTTAGEFLREWRIQEFLRQFPELAYIRTWLPEVLHFDADNSIIVVNYLADYQDLADFYAKKNDFPTSIATSIGAILATIHRATMEHQEYREFFQQDRSNTTTDSAPNLKLGLERISPEVFGQVPDDGLKFFALYQRYDSLGKAIAELSQAYRPCCLTHNDLKLNNILLPLDWAQMASTAVQPPSIPLRLIDWERSTWGDPAFDLGSLMTSYLVMWLGSLVVSKSIGIEEALRLAMTPLELLQPSLAALTNAYFTHFPEILEYRPDFLQRVMQFSGLGLIRVIQSILEYQKSFENTGICMLQVAKTLLCRPEPSIQTIFGVKESEFVGAV
jgi:hypothetical protein